MTQDDLAREVGKANAKTIGNFESGRNWPHGTTLRGIERALGLRLGALDRLGSVSVPADEDATSPPESTRLSGVPTERELLYISEAVDSLLKAQAEAVSRDDADASEKLRVMIVGVNSGITSYREALRNATRDTTSRPSSEVVE